MKLTIFLFLICSLLNAVYAKKIATFPELYRPGDVIIDGDHLFISDCPSVYIYSFKDGDIQLIKKIGRGGVGPGEFRKIPASFKINVQPDYIFVNATRKIAYYTRTGELIREKNVVTAGYSFFALKDKLIGRKVVYDNNKEYMAIKMFNSHLEEECELTRQLSSMQPGVRDVKAYTVAYDITAGGNKIFAVSSVDFIIKIFDYQGKLLHTIEEKNRTKCKKIENKHKEAFHNYMNIVLPTYKNLKDDVIFPEYFPAIHSGGLKYDYNEGKERLYVVTWKKKNSNLQCVIFDTKGTFIKEAYLPIKEQNAVRLYPFQVKDGKIYQLIENDNDDWELHMNRID